MGMDQLLVQHGPHVVQRELLDLVHLVAGAEAVEEVNEGDASLQRGRLDDQGLVHHLLHGVGGQQAEAGLTDCHHIAMVAEDGQGVGGERPRGDVEGRGSQLAGDLVHVGDHQEQALGRGERGGEGSALQRPVHRAGGAALALHLHDQGDRPPDVGNALGRVLVRPLPHIGGRSDRVDRDHLVGAVGDISRRFVAVNRNLRSAHRTSPRPVGSRGTQWGISVPTIKSALNGSRPSHKIKI